MRFSFFILKIRISEKKLTLDILIIHIFAKKTKFEAFAIRKTNYSDNSNKDNQRQKWESISYCF